MIMNTRKLEFLLEKVNGINELGHQSGTYRARRERYGLMGSLYINELGDEQYEITYMPSDNEDESFCKKALHGLIPRKKRKYTL